MKHMKKIVALFLVLVSTLSLTVPAMAVTFATGTAKIGDLNVRSGPGTSYDRKGDRIEVNSTFDLVFECTGSTLNGSNKWYYVESIDCACGSSSCNAPLDGYIHSSYVNGVYIRLSPSDANEAFGYTTLRSGDYGPEVFNVQLVLWANGYLDSLSDCDGLFGSGTAAALEEFQTDNYLNYVDGIVGDETRAELWAERYFVMNGNDFLNLYGVQCWD